MDDVDGFYKYNRGFGEDSCISRGPIGLINTKEADLNKFYFTDGLYSAISIPERLSDAEAAAPEFREIEDGECIILKDKNPDPKSSVKQVPIDYKDTRNTKRMRKELIAYNALLVRSHIDLGSLKGPYVEVRHQSRIRENEKYQKLFGEDKWTPSKLFKRIPVNQSIEVHHQTVC